jgi:hypothetical protein
MPRTAATLRPGGQPPCGGACGPGRGPTPRHRHGRAGVCCHGPVDRPPPVRRYGHPPRARWPPRRLPGPGAPGGARAVAGACAAPPFGCCACLREGSTTLLGVKESRARRPGPRGAGALRAPASVGRPSSGQRRRAALWRCSRLACHPRVAGVGAGPDGADPSLGAPVGLVGARLPGPDAAGEPALTGPRAEGQGLAPSGDGQASWPW